MAVFDKVKNTMNNIANSTSDREPTPTLTLETLKDQVNTKEITYNKYNNYWLIHNIDIDYMKQRAQVIDNCANGVGKFYDNVINDDIIYTMVNNISAKTLNDITYNVLKLNGEEVEITPKNELQRTDTTTKLMLHKDTFKKLFEYLYMYEKVALKVDIVNGQYKIIPLKPYEYNIDQYGTIEIIVGFDNKGKAIVEKRASNNGNYAIDGQFTEDLYFYEFYFNSRLFNKLELILDYQLIAASITKEVELNKSKVFMDKKMFKDKFINKEAIQLVDVPSTVSDRQDNIGSYFNVSNTGTNDLNSLSNALDGKSKKLVNGLRLSRKTLGLSESVDFASSLPYENELTAETINEYREQLTEIITSFLMQLLKRNDIAIDLGKYKLTSKEAILDQNNKATQSKSESVSKKVANILDKDVDDIDVITETIKIKLENNIIMTMEEETFAQELGLIPKSTSFSDELEVI